MLDFARSNTISTQTSNICLNHLQWYGQFAEVCTLLEVSGVARNLSRGSKSEEVSGTEVPQLGPGAEPRWGSGAKLPEADEFATKMFRILIAR